MRSRVDDQLEKGSEKFVKKLMLSGARAQGDVVIWSSSSLMMDLVVEEAQGLLESTSDDSFGILRLCLSAAVLPRN